MRKVGIVLLGLLLGIALGYLLILSPWQFLSNLPNQPKTVTPTTKKVIGFLPFWLTTKAQGDYSHLITELSYFSLSIDTDGHIKKLNSPVEEEPGWYTLRSGKMNILFKNAQKKNISLSLTVFTADNSTIDQLLSDPVVHAHALSADVIPIMKTYSFSDLNLDVEQLGSASPSAQKAFTTFSTELKNDLSSAKVGSLTIDVSPSALIEQERINPSQIASVADYILVMGYDIHSIGSQSIGPMAPLYGAGMDEEYDINTLVTRLLKAVPAQKILVGIPSYGYEWETIDSTPRAAVIPGTGLIASTDRVSRYLSSCTNCKTTTDPRAKEGILTYFASDTDSYHQFYYPTADSTQRKIQFVDTNHLGGLAVWALGYEDQTVLTPLAAYLK